MTIQASELKRHHYFSTLSIESFEGLARKLVRESFPAGALIIREGEPGDCFYFVKEGRLEATMNTRCGQVARLSLFGGGQGFGEMSLLTGAARFSSVRAVTAVTLYRLMKPDFDDLVGREPAFRNVLLKTAADHSHFNKIKTLQPFILLEPDKMYALMARMTEKTYSLGEDIIVQGEKGDYYYIVKSGRVAVLRKKKGEPVDLAAVLTEGDGFGEEALIRDDPRNATCRAIEETTVYALDKVDFDQVLKASFLGDIFAEDISVTTYREKYVFIDARVASEYEQEHIEGALNIPVEVLRGKYAELEPGKSYITYCTNDARGMVAAFLLKNHGFDAKCLRGGISSWEGPTAAMEGGGKSAVGNEAKDTV
jgi:CRP-like cAMP-binding protein